MIDEFLEDWGRTKSSTTLESWRYVLEQFDEEVGLEGVTKEEIYDWLDYKIDGGLKRTTANQYIQMLKSFHLWLRDNLPTPVGEEELRETLEEQKRCNRIVNMDRYRAAGRSGKPIAKDTLTALLDMAEGGDYHLFYLLGYFGFRKNELYTLRWEDVDLANRSLHIRAPMTKTYSSRELYFNDYVAELLGEMSMVESDYVIGFEADRNFLNRRLERYDDEVGEHLYPHRFRHTFNQEMRLILKDPILVKWLMGHQTSGDMTARYSEPIEDIAREAMTERHYFHKFGIYEGI